MRRRTFIDKTLAGTALFGGTMGMSGATTAHAQASQEDFDYRLNITDNVVIERDAPGQPHKGKVLLHIMAHNDDHSGTGTAIKLIKEGYTGYYARFSNEDKSGPGSVGEACVLLEEDTKNIAKTIGHKKVFDLCYRKHSMNDVWLGDLIHRLIFLYRLLQVDTIITFDPWSHYEENPDHYLLARAVEASRWYSGRVKDFPEHFKAGIKPKEPKECYYFSRGPNLSQWNFTRFNRIVDIGSVIEQKIEAQIAGRWWGGPAGMEPEDRRKRSLTRGGRSELLKRFGLKYGEFFNYRSRLGRV